MSETNEIGKSKHSPWDNRTSSSWLHGIEYRVLEDPDDIYDFVNTVIRKELATDLQNMERVSNSNEVMDSLAIRRWKLEPVKLCDIQLNPMIVESYDIKTRRRFTDRLKERTSELRRVLDNDGTAIWPLVLVDDAHLLIDGYCRHSTLTEMGIPRAYGYSGLLPKSTSRTVQ